MKKNLLSFLAGVALASVMFYAYSGWSSMTEAAYESCTLSAQDRIRTELLYSEIKHKIDVDVEWRHLTVEEKNLVFERLREASFDCHRFPYIREGKTSSGGDLGVSVRRVNNNIEVKIYEGP